MDNKLAEKWLGELTAELSLLDDIAASSVEILRHAIPVITRIMEDVKKWS